MPKVTISDSKGLVQETGSGLTVNSFTVTLTPTTLAVSATIATTEIGSAYILMWTADGWAVLSRSSNVNAGATAVTGMPVLAG